MKPAPQGRIKIININKSYAVNERLVKKIANNVLKSCLPRGKAELGFIFVTDRRIRVLNKKYKGENRATDVLSFDLSVNESHKTSPLLGDIFISIDKARKNSRIFKTSLEKEFVLYIIHGILHLAGYDDENRKDRAKMEDRQEAILQGLCKRENLSKVLTPR